MSRTTAYRYFPTQESLLVEVAVNVDVDDIERLVQAPVESGSAPERALNVLELFNRHVFAAESQYRTALRAYLDLWLATANAGHDVPVVREGRCCRRQRLNDRVGYWPMRPSMRSRSRSA